MGLLSLPADAPGRPQDVRVLEASSRQVKLTWLAPQDERGGAGGAPGQVLQYSVQVQQVQPVPQPLQVRVIIFRKI